MVFFLYQIWMNFETKFLAEAKDFISKLDKNVIAKVLYTIDLAEKNKDPRLTKLKNDIWEFRTRYEGVQIKLLAFWSREESKEILVLATQGIVTKGGKIPVSEIERTLKIAKTNIKLYSLSEMKDQFVGEILTQERNDYEYELRMDVLGKMIKKARKERNLSQEQLGSLIGVKIAQIAKLENSVDSASIDTMIKAFKIFNAEISFNVKLENENLQVL